jgi:hypothetical protein
MAFFTRHSDEEESLKINKPLLELLPDIAIFFAHNRITRLRITDETPRLHAKNVTWRNPRRPSPMHTIHSNSGAARCLESY